MDRKMAHVKGWQCQLSLAYLSGWGKHRREG